MPAQQQQRVFTLKVVTSLVQAYGQCDSFELAHDLLERIEDAHTERLTATVLAEQRPLALPQ